MPRNKKITSVLSAIIGDKKTVPLENRTVNGICLGSSFLFLSGFLICVLLNNPGIFKTVYFVLGFLYITFYIISRVWRKSLLAVYLMIPCLSAYIAFLWFFDGGISGPATLLSLLFIILISPMPNPRLRWALIFFIFSGQGLLYYTQYFYPDRVQAYQSLGDQFIGHYIIFIFVSLVTASLVNFIFTNLAREREHANRARKQLKESEYLFRTLAETTSTAIVLHQDGKFAYANPAAQDLFDYSLKELKEKHFKDLIVSEDRNRLNTDIKTISGIEIRILTRYGKETPVYFEASPIEYYDRPAGLVSMIDLTRLREAETNLFNLQNYLSDIIDSMPSILVGVDEEMSITQWNRHAEKQTAVSEQNAMGADLFHTIPRLEAEKKKILSAVSQRRLMESLRYAYEDSGQQRFEEITIYPLEKSGSKGAVIRLDDVTEKVRLEEIIIQSEKMASIGGLAAGMAHEINNPLAGIMQNVQLAKSRLTENLPANVTAAEKAGTSMTAIKAFMEQRKIFNLLNNINTAGGRAAKIVENMLSFAKKGTPKQHHDIAHLLSKSLELASSDYSLKKLYDFKGIHIVREFDENLPEVYCEENKIMQVFFNILANAAQAMQNDKVAVSDPTLVLRISESKGMVQVEIEDNGSGMNEETKKKVFEPFFTTRDINEGTGLGLSLSYFIVVKDHKGEMRVESTPGNGTNFIIRLPIN